MHRKTPSPVQTTPIKKRLRFAGVQIAADERESSDSEDDDREVLRTPPGKSSSPVINSPTNGHFSTLPGDGGPVSPTLTGRHIGSKPYPSFTLASVQCPIVLHSALDTAASFVWDMATSPEDLKLLPIEGDDPVARSAVEQEPVDDGLVFHVDGIYEWQIVVQSAEGECPTVRDAFNSIHTNVMKLVAKRDVERLHDYHRRRVYEAREARCRDFALDPEKEPLRRVDFLLGARRFLGVSVSDKFTLNAGALPLRV